MATFYDRMIALEIDSSWQKEDEGYREFVKNDLKRIISKIKNSSSDRETASYCEKAIEFLNIRYLSYVLMFFEKYGLIHFYTQKICGINYKYKKGLCKKDIYAAYEKELAYVNKKTPVKNEKKNLKPSVFERLDKYTNIEERQDHIHELKNNYESSLRLTEEENGYYNFIMDIEKGLYRVLENALYKYDGKKFILEYNPLNINFECIKEFCDKYGIVIKMIERGEKISKDYLPNVKTLADIRNLFNFYFMELQQMEYFSKSKEELWQEHNEFVTNNQEWIEKKKEGR